MTSRPTNTAARSIHPGANGTWILVKGIPILRTHWNRSADMSPQHPRGYWLKGKGRMSKDIKRTHSQPAGHSAISDCAHTPETKSEASRMTPERNLENMAGGDKIDEGAGR